MKAAGVIVAAGRGERAGRPLPKQFEPLAGRPMLFWSLAAMRASPQIDRIVVVVDPEHVERAQAAAGGVDFQPVAGGAMRTDSVRAGLEALADTPTTSVLIHDAARPGLTNRVIEDVLAPLADVSGAAPALPVSDALKRADGDGRVIEDAARAGLYRVQTPQAFRYADILAAYRALPADTVMEDDIAVARAAGLAVRLVPGDMALSKVTMPEDFDAVARFERPRTGVTSSICPGASPRSTGCAGSDLTPLLIVP